MNEFVQNLQKGYETPAEVVFDLVERVTGQVPVRRKKIVKGYENEVVEVETRQAEAFMVRIRRVGQVGFRQEAWAIEQCRAAGVPAPEILLVETIQSHGHGLEAMVQRRIAGRPLAALLGGLTKPALQDILRQVGEVLGRIHTIRVEGFGRRHGDGAWDFPTWGGTMDARLRSIEGEMQHLIQASFDAQELDFMLAMLHHYRKEFPCRQPVLCHGDVEPEHIFVDSDLKVAGVIDFGQILGGAPMEDFIHLSFVQPALDLAFVRSGYPDRGMVQDRSDRRLHLHRLGFLMGCVAHITRAGDVHADKAPDAPGQLWKTLAALRQWD